MPKILKCGCGKEIQVGSSESYKWFINNSTAQCPTCQSKPIKPKPGFLDTEEKVREAYNRLGEATKDDFEKLNNAARQSMLEAREIIVD